MAGGDDATVAVAGEPAPAAVPLPPIPTWAPGDVIMERYRVERVMAGSMGKIYICDHLGWGIARLSPETTRAPSRSG